jgi:hypothetical protein
MAPLKRQRNTLVPVARLPAEILTIILKLVVQIESKDDDGHSPSLSSLTLSHVSHAWRNLALSCTHLWTNVDIQYPGLAIHCVAQSGDQPLDMVVFFDGKEPPYDPDSDTLSPRSALEYAMSEIYRIQSFTIHMPNQGEEEFCTEMSSAFGLMALDMVALRHLFISFLDSEAYEPDPVDMDLLFVNGTSAYSQLSDLQLLGAYVSLYHLENMSLVTLVMPRDSKFE